jgi:hypothetical protein
MYYVIGSNPMLFRSLTFDTRNIVRRKLFLERQKSLVFLRCIDNFVLNFFDLEPKIIKIDNIIL